MSRSISDSYSLSGEVVLSSFRSLRDLYYNEPYEKIAISNLVVTAGRVWLAQRAGSASPPTRISHIGVGSDATSPTLADTLLGTELSRVALDSQPVVSNTIIHSATFLAGIGTGTWKEAGLFNTSSGGPLLARTVFSDYIKSVDLITTIRWTLTIISNYN